MSATCATCGAPIIWAVTASGTRMPLDATPDLERGNVRLFSTGQGEPDVAYVYATPADARKAWIPGSKSGWVPHFATCPDADMFRRRPKASA